ncbi:hypothetical protein GCM10008090_19980 [Arenicella chitinivorans]|uniref:Uncharacterized protein n=1 Tax=Arenicella chitinivorans TaxID=1329800 RepID=A0A918RTG9_9GAMM|nr:hypothetical protein [Arenicella chitinivorans]GHA10390.1 hypothetical protein GCM10008090_19980 [Arenicella chitinivorans]
MAGDSVNQARIPVAVGSINFDGTIRSGYGISSVTHTADGSYTINCTGTINPQNPIIIVSPYTASPGTPKIVGYGVLSANSFTVTIQNTQGSGVDSAFAFTAYSAPSSKLKSSGNAEQGIDGPTDPK